MSILYSWLSLLVVTTIKLDIFNQPHLTLYAWQMFRKHISKFISFKVNLLATFFEVVESEINPKDIIVINYFYWKYLGVGRGQGLKFYV